ncbi:unnamed protein product [Zymoseptoria tritici ST99CH_1A5]|uniref:Uncharacterized protein n=1 Tax=Zymoseptoria tritici ST99CH_1A5 TaxID=1276529 RepID=A0A1Y6M2V4_ZYMTR|nr:unnamed protein product [Zymoseptoria tritici ST99CH_1A5]
MSNHPIRTPPGTPCTSDQGGRVHRSARWTYLPEVVSQFASWWSISTPEKRISTALHERGGLRRRLIDPPQASKLKGPAKSNLQHFLNFCWQCEDTHDVQEADSAAKKYLRFNRVPNFGQDTHESVEEANSAAEKYLHLNRVPKFGHPDGDYEEGSGQALIRTLHAAHSNHKDDEHTGADNEADDSDPPATDRSSHPSSQHL